MVLLSFIAYAFLIRLLKKKNFLILTREKKYREAGNLRLSAKDRLHYSCQQSSSRSTNTNLDTTAKNKHLGRKQNYVALPYQNDRMTLSYRTSNPQAKMEKEFYEASVIKNCYATADDCDPVVSLKHLQEMFVKKLEPDVVTMIFNECDCNVENALETLFSLTTELNNESAEKSCQQKFKKNENFEPKLKAKSKQQTSARNSPKCTKQNVFPKEMDNRRANSVQGSFNHQLFVPHQPNIQECYGRPLYGSFTMPKLPTGAKLNEKSNSNVCNKNKPKDAGRGISVSSAFAMPHVNYMRGEALASAQYTKNSPASAQGKAYFAMQKWTRQDASQLQRSQTFPSTSTSGVIHRRPRTAVNNSEIEVIKRSILKGDKILILLRGLPGSGKTTYAQKLKFTGVVLSTDDYFVRNGLYSFDWSKLSEAHEWNKNRAKTCMTRGVTPIIIDNTNTEAWEMKPYMGLGLAFNYTIHILEPPTPWKFNLKELAKHNIHGVPKDKLSQMLLRYEHDITVDSVLRTMNKFSFNSNQNNTNINNTVQPTNTNTALQHKKVDRVLHSNTLAVNKCNKNKDKRMTEQIKKRNNKKSKMKRKHKSKLQKNNEPESSSQVLPAAENQETNSLLCGLSNFLNIKDNTTNCIAGSKGENDEPKKQMNLEELLSLNRQSSETSLSLQTVGNVASNDVWEWEPVSEFQWSKDSSKKMFAKDPSGNDVIEEDSSENGEEDEAFAEAENDADEESDDSDDDDDDSESELEGASISINLDEIYASSSSIESIGIEDNLHSPVLSNNITESVKSPELPLTLGSHHKVIVNDIIQSTVSKNASQLSEVVLFASEELDSNCISNQNTSHQIQISDNEFGKPVLEIDKPLSSDLSTWNDNVEKKISSEMYPSVEVLESSPQREHRKPRLKTIERFTNVNKCNSKEETMVCSEESNDIIEAWVDVSCKEIAAQLWENVPNNADTDSIATEEPKPQRVTAKYATNSDVLPAVHDYLDGLNQSNSEVYDGNQLNFPRRSKIAAKLDYFLKTNSDSSPESQYLFGKCTGITNTNIEALLKSPSMNSAGTQTEPTDFNICQQIINGNSNPSPPFKLLLVSKDHEHSIGSTSEFHTKLQAPQSTLFLEKGTSTEDMPELLSREEKIIFLRSCFPCISSDDLHDIFEKCHGDVAWAINILLDFGYDYNMEKSKHTDMVSEEETSKDTLENKCENVNFKTDALMTFSECKNEVNAYSEKVNELQVSGTSEEITTETVEKEDAIPLLEESDSKEILQDDSVVANETWANDSVNQKSNDAMQSLKFVLTLDRAFALQLEELFGPVGFHITPDAHTDGHLSVMIGMDLAQEIHRQWSITHKETIEAEETAMENMIMKDKNDKSIEENSLFYKPAVQQSGWEEEFPSLNDISKKSLVSQEEKNKIAAQKLNRFQEIFPGLDKSFLEDVLISNNYFLPRAVDIIEETLGFPAQNCLYPTAVISASDKSFSKIAKNGNFQIIKSETNEELLADDGGEDFELTNASGYEDFRAEATVQYRLRQECFKKAQEAYRKGMKEVASFYSQQGHIHSEKLRWANKRAAEKILQWRNSHTEPNVLDLHGLHVQEALEALDRFLARKVIELKQSPLSKFTLFIITGRGKRSANGIAKLRPAILAHFQKHSYRTEEVYEGVIKVILT